MSESCLIIAEAGVNHNGDPGLARELIRVAAEAGADIIKFQTFRAEALVTARAEKAAYQAKATAQGESQLDMLRRLELPPEEFFRLAQYAQEQGIGFLSTPFDLESLALLARMELPLIKIPSGEITNLPYLRELAAHNWDVVLSTGMSEPAEVEAALRVLEAAGKPPSAVTLLHCTTEYPAPPDQVNLRAMRSMREAFPRCAGVGYSDHTQGIDVALAAAALGASVLEKHFTLDKSLPGPDHKASLCPEELRAMVRGVRNITLALGSARKEVVPVERANRLLVRKSIVAARDIAAGEILSAENLTTKRPGTGLSPMHWDDVIGKRAVRAIRRDEFIKNSFMA